MYEKTYANNIWTTGRLRKWDQEYPQKSKYLKNYFTLLINIRKTLKESQKQRERRGMELEDDTSTRELQTQFTDTAVLRTKTKGESGWIQSKPQFGGIGIERTPNMFERLPPHLSCLW